MQTVGLLTQSIVGLQVNLIFSVIQILLKLGLVRSQLRGEPGLKDRFGRVKVDSLNELEISLNYKQPPCLAWAALAIAVCIGHPANGQAAGEETYAHCLQSMKILTKGSPQLTPFVGFFQKQSRLAKVVDGQILAEEAGTKGTNFWVLVLNEFEKSELNVSTTFQFDPTQDLFTIADVPISSVWMGMGCIHETVHAKDILDGTESRNASRQEFLAGELRAYQVELEAIDTFTQGAFSQTISGILQDKLYEQRGKFIIPNKDAQRSLDQLSPQPIPQSTAERSVRDGFYVVALNFARLPDEQDRLSFLETLMGLSQNHQKP